MPEVIVMPKFGMTMEKGVISQWYKKEGEKVEKGEPVLEVLTDKANMDVESPKSGILFKIFFNEGEEVEVGKVIAILKLPSESDEDVERFIEKLQNQYVSEKEEVKKDIKTHILATPFAKRLIREYDVNLEDIKKKGIITSKDINIEEEVSLSPIQRSMAEKMTESAKIPQFVLYYQIKSRFIELINELLKEKGVPSTITPILIKALSIVIKEFPIFKSRFENGKLIKLPHIDIGFAVGTDEGLFVPVIKRVDSMDIKEIVRTFRSLVEKAKNKKLSPSDLEGGCVTVSNLGMYEVEFFKPLLVPGQVAIFGVSRIRDGVMNMSIVCDHRIIDGKKACEFMLRFKKMVENYSDLRKIIL